jgi:uncharacterized protein YdeI (BOF family)
MFRLILISAAFLISSSGAIAEEAEDTQGATSTEAKADGINGPKTLSGMSILSSEMGDDIGLSDTLDDRARPVDKEVFLRELSFYEIRSGK